MRAAAQDSASECFGGAALSRPVSLKKPQEFAAVFAAKRASRGKHLAFNVRPNASPVARLGLAVSRRAARRAVRRNYMKRVLRELFARRAETLGGLDVVISVSLGFERAGLETVRAEFERHAEAVQKWRASSSS